MTDWPLVSVVTPTFNQARFLAETIDSVLSQDYPRVQLIVVNDGSTDETEDILQSYGTRVVWQAQPNLGQTAAINAGWRRATGTILAWLNSDDTLLPGAIHKAVSFLIEHQEVAVVYGQSLFVNDEGDPMDRAPAGGPFDYASFVRRCENPIPQPSAFIRRKVYEDVGPLDPTLYYFMDWDLWLRAGLRHRIEFLPEALSTYRLHEESKTVAGQRRAAPELERIYRRFFASPNLPREIADIQAQALANMYFTTAGCYLQAGDLRSARVAAFRAVREDRSLLLRVDGLHKLAYVLFGRARLYALLRGAARGAAASERG